MNGTLHVTETSEAETRKQVFDAVNTHLGSQLAITIAADQRAVSLGGVYIAAGTAIVAGLVAYVASADTIETAVLASGLSSALTFVYASIQCFLSIRPAIFFVPGHCPEDVLKRLDCSDGLIGHIGATDEELFESIASNDEVLIKRSEIFQHGLLVGAAAPVVGILAWGAASYFA